MPCFRLREANQSLTFGWGCAACGLQVRGLSPVAGVLKVQQSEAGGGEIIAGARLRMLHDVTNIRNESLQFDRDLHLGHAGAGVKQRLPHYEHTGRLI